MLRCLWFSVLKVCSGELTWSHLWLDNNIGIFQSLFAVECVFLAIGSVQYMVEELVDCWNHILVMLTDMGIPAAVKV